VPVAYNDRKPLENEHSMPKTTETSGFSIPPALLQEAARIAKAEGRTGGALFRDMLRTYKSRPTQPKLYDEAWAMNVIREAQEEERLHPMTPEELKREDEELRRYGVAQAKKLGLKSKDIDRLLQARNSQPKRKRESRS
jgi:hypothetical protein